MTVRLRYFAILREQRGLTEEVVQLEVQTVDDLYQWLREQHSFSLDLRQVRASVNGTIVATGTLLADGDEVVFIPPVAGG